MWWEYIAAVRHGEHKSVSETMIVTYVEKERG